jgi:hypothetical protein
MLRVVAPIVAGIVFVVFAYFLLRGGEESRMSESPPPAPPVAPPPSVARPEPPVEPALPPRALPAPAEPMEAVEPPPAQVEPLPALAESDALVRRELDGLEWPPGWTPESGIARRAVAAIENAQRGEIYRRPLAFLRPETSFRIIEQDGRIYADPANEARFDGFVEAVLALDPEALVRVFTRLEPLLDEGFGELGSPVGSREALVAALDEVIASRLPPGPHELVRPRVLWQYADPAIEGASDLDKQLLRLGVENRERLQSAAARLKQALSDDY